MWTLEGLEGRQMLAGVPEVVVLKAVGFGSRSPLVLGPGVDGVFELGEMPAGLIHKERGQVGLVVQDKSPSYRPWYSPSGGESNITIKSVTLEGEGFFSPSVEVVQAPLNAKLVDTGSAYFREGREGDNSGGDRIDLLGWQNQPAPTPAVFPVTLADRNY